MGAGVPSVDRITIGAEGAIGGKGDACDGADIPSHEFEGSGPAKRVVVGNGVFRLAGVSQPEGVGVLGGFGERAV